MRSVITSLLCLLLLSSGVSAQLPDSDNLPDASLMTVTAVDDEPYRVTITGDPGAVFQSAQIAARNLNTAETVFGQANFDGSFALAIDGTPGQMYRVHAAVSYPPGLRDTYEVLPGTGVLLYQPPGERTFQTGGALSYTDSGATWQAEGTFDALQLQPDERFNLQLDVVMRLPEAALNLDYTMSGELYLRRVVTFTGRVDSFAKEAGYGWSSVFNQVDLPVTGAPDDDTPVATATADTLTVNEDDNTLSFSLTFEALYGANQQPGLYVPIFIGEARIADSEPFNWFANRVFSTEGRAVPDFSETVLPAVLQLAPESEALYLPVSLFGRAPDEHRENYAMAAPDGFTPPVTVRSPGTYSLAPLLPSLLRDGHDAPPLLPVTTATLSTTISSPDDSRQTLESSGLVTLDTRLYAVAPDFEFSQYGTYQIEQSGTVSDATGRAYDISGTYAVTIAEPLTIYPAMLPGTPLQPGDTFDGAFQVEPAFPAEKTVSLYRSPSLTVLDDCTADCRFLFEETGEYSAVYNARYTDSQGRLWAGSLQTAGVSGLPGRVAEGARGLLEDGATPQTWFDTRVYPPDVPDAAPLVNFPFFSGDVAFLSDDDRAGVHPLLQSENYSHLSIIRVTGTTPANHAGIERQQASDNYPPQPLTWRLSETDVAPEDILLLLGGAVDATGLRGYASAAVITDDDFVRVLPPLSEPLLIDRGEPLRLLLLPGNLTPGQVLTAGEDTFFTAQSVPPLPVDVTLTTIAPDATSQTQTLQANPFGYVTSEALSLDTPGIWQIDVRADYAGVTSAGQLDAPVSGTVPGADGTRYRVFVVPENTPPLETSRPGQTAFAPGQPVTLNLRAPETWQDVRAYAVVSARGVLLDQSEPGVFSNQTNYTYNPAQIARLYPNISAADTITLHFAMTGIDPNGVSRIRTRVFTLRDNTLITTNSSPTSQE